MSEPTKKPKMQKFPIVIETFRALDGFDTSRLIQTEPDAFNGIVNWRKYRVTIEAIEEPHEVLAERIRKLWRECDNCHQFSPIRDAALSIGVELDHKELGRDRKPRQ